MRATTGIIRKGRIPPRSTTGSATRMYGLLNTESILRDTITAWTDSDHPDTAVPGVEQAVEVVHVVRELLTWTTDKTNSAVLGRVRSDPAYEAAIVALEQPVVALRGHLNAMHAGLHESLPSATAAVLAVLGQVLDVVRGGLRTLPVKGQLAALKRIQDFRQQVTDLALTNEAATNDLSSHEHDGATALGAELQASATTELKAANRWRGTSVALMVFIAALAAAILFGTPLAADDVHGDLARLSVTVPLGVLAGYMSRESSKHRDRSQRALDFALHLRHLRSFSAPLDDEERRKYRVELGQRAWPPQDPPPPADSLAGVTEELARLTEVLRGRVDGPDDPS